MFVGAHETGVFPGNRDRGTNRLSGEAGFPEEGPTFQHRDDSFFALRRHHGQLDLARLDIEHSPRGLPLRKDNLLLGGRQHASSVAWVPCPLACVAHLAVAL